MKRLGAIALAILIVAAALPLGAAAAPEFIGEVTVSIPGYDGLDITLSDAASKWADHVESMYGTYNMIVVAPDSTVTFSRDVALNNMGAPSGSAAAGTAVSISSIDGNYVYADDGVLYTIFSTTSSQSYTEESLNKDIAEIAAGAPASAPPAANEPPASAPPPASGGATLSLPEIAGLEITLSDAYDNYAYGPFVFNPAQNAYTFYLNPAGTITFSRDVTVVKTDMFTYEQADVLVSGGTATPIADINGAALYFSDDRTTSDFATFADLTDPTYAAGLSAATIPLSALGSGGGGSAPAPAAPDGSAPAPAAPPASSLSGSTIIAIPGYEGMEVTITGVGPRWGDHISSEYGTFNMIVVDAAGSIMFNKDVTLNNMGAEMGSYPANVPIAIASINGYYVYADDAILYTIFTTTTSMSYNEASINADIADITIGQSDETLEAEVIEPSYAVFDAEMKRIYVVGVPIAGGMLVVCLINMAIQSKKYKYLDVYYKETK
jgi:hypothetical protein